MTDATRSKRATYLSVGILGAILVGACAPKTYQPPAATLVPAYKENAEWKQAAPQDQALHGDWWTLFGDQQLNSLETRLAVSNQVLRAAAAQFEQARALVRIAHAGQQPTVVFAPSIGGAQPSGTRATSSFHDSYADFLLPLGVSYEADVWARVRNVLNASERTAQATAADIESVSLTLHAELAGDYVALIGLDDTARLFDQTVQDFERAFELTRNRFQGGLASQADVALAETQLESTRAQRVDLEVARSALEHAIAVLIGQPAGSFALTRDTRELALPVVPVGLPSELLERRPDIAGAERRVAAANAQVGATESAWYPLLTLSGTTGFESASFGRWLAAASHFWTIVPTAAVTVFDAGRRHAVTDQATAIYDQTTAAYQQSVLNAFREVEDQLAALRVLEDEASVESRAVTAAAQSLTLATNRYRGGIANYLEVLTAQTNLLGAQRTALSIQTRRFLASVQLVKALGGGWSRQQLPTVIAVRSGSATDCQTPPCD